MRSFQEFIDNYPPVTPRFISIKKDDAQSLNVVNSDSCKAIITLKIKQKFINYHLSYKDNFLRTMDKLLQPKDTTVFIWTDKF